MLNMLNFLRAMLTFLSGDSKDASRLVNKVNKFNIVIGLKILTPNEKPRRRVRILELSDKTPFSSGNSRPVTYLPHKVTPMFCVSGL
jgi:hypothetical protein